MRRDGAPASTIRSRRRFALNRAGATRQLLLHHRQLRRRQLRHLPLRCVVKDDGGRGEKIRTSDPLHPMQVRYQAALRPDVLAIITEGIAA